MSTDLPPEAYTKETLQAAFDWLQTQPDVVRSSVHTPEHLVSLFQKSQRLNDTDHPVSSKKFVTDLKSLASSLDQFSGNPTTYVAQPVNIEPPQQTTTQTVKKASFEVTTNTQAPTPSPSPALVFDPLTQSRIQQVKERFNLSSEQEAMRVLVSLGYEKFSQFL